MTSGNSGIVFDILRNLVRVSVLKVLFHLTWLPYMLQKRDFLV